MPAFACGKRFPWSEGTTEVEVEHDQRDFREIISKVKIAFSMRSAQLGIVLSLVMSLSFFLIPVLPLLFVPPPLLLPLLLLLGLGLPLGERYVNLKNIDNLRSHW